MASIASALVNTSNEFNQALAKQKGSALDKDAFMLLLVTQFKHQDPLNPMEDKDFIAQLSQFSSLEQLMNLNDGMSGLTDATKQQQMLNATSYIGKSVDATGATISRKTDTTTNKVTTSTFRYAIGESMVEGTISVYDANNQLVNSYPVPAQAKGTYDFEWDGKSFSGNAPDGVYRVVPNLKNADGKALQYDAVVSGKVSGAITDNGVTYLTLDDGRTVALANVRRVSEASTTTDTGTTDKKDTENKDTANKDAGSTDTEKTT